jgi:hypothetical protein
VTQAPGQGKDQRLRQVVGDVRGAVVMLLMDVAVEHRGIAVGHEQFHRLCAIDPRRRLDTALGAEGSVTALDGSAKASDNRIHLTSYSGFCTRLLADDAGHYLTCYG